jgi:hypothetical protein
LDEPGAQLGASQVLEFERVPLPHRRDASAVVLVAGLVIGDINRQRWDDRSPVLGHLWIANDIP